jgi:RpiB/LacA/LacB family sugar-phosphate isomerase
MKIYLGADHRGVNFKKRIAKIIRDLGYTAVDLGSFDPKVSCDYPKVAYQVATRVARSTQDRGILVCMSGIGQMITANKVRGAYAALCHNAASARLSRMHNNANILVLGSKFVKAKDIRMIIKTWLTTEFEGGRHKRRVDQIKKIEKGMNI